VIQIQPFHCSTIQDVMVDTPKSHKYRYALEYITCLHHIILDSSVPGQPAAATWRCGSGHGAVPWRVVGVCGGGAAGHVLCRCWATRGASPRTRGCTGTLTRLPHVGREKPELSASSLPLVPRRMRLHFE
jgi:hypothetical protein